MAVSTEHLTCPICLDIFRLPRALLPCLHNFCEMCLKDYIVDKVNRGQVNSGFECPFCRKFVAEPAPNKLPQEWAALYPLNHLIVSLVDCLQCQENGWNTNNEQTQGSVLENHDRERRELGVESAKPHRQSTVSEDVGEVEQTRKPVKHISTSFPCLNISPDESCTCVPTAKQYSLEYNQFVINSQTHDSIRQIGVMDCRKTDILQDEIENSAPSRNLGCVKVCKDDRAILHCKNIKGVTQENNLPVVTAQCPSYNNVEYGNDNGSLVSGILPQNYEDAAVSTMESEYIMLGQDAILTDPFEGNNGVYQDCLQSLEDLPPTPPECGPQRRPPDWCSHFNRRLRHSVFGHMPPHHATHGLHHLPTFYAAPRHQPSPHHPPPHHPPPHHPPHHHPPPHHPSHHHPPPHHLPRHHPPPHLPPRHNSPRHHPPPPNHFHPSLVHGLRSHCPCSVCHTPP